MFWKDSPEHESGEVRAEDIQTEVFFLPAAAHTEKDGNFTNTQRLLQWHHKACEPPGECRSELHWIYHLGKRIREKLAGSEDPKDRPILDLTWDYPLGTRTTSRIAEHVLQEISGRKADGSFLSSYDELADDGSTTCGSWIHCGIYKDGVNQSARKKPHTEQNWIAHEWGWAWPKDCRILYNRASADPDGKPWSERKRYVWWDAEEGQWTSLGDSPDFPPTKAPDYRPPRRRQEDGGDRRRQAVHPAPRRPWLALRADRPRRRAAARALRAAGVAVRNPLYAQQQNPTRQVFHRPENPYHPFDGEPGAEVFPFVLTTYRLTEHHTAGGMSRTVPLPGRASARVLLRGLAPAGGRARARARRLGHDRHRAQAVEARVLVTDADQAAGGPRPHHAPRRRALSLGRGRDRHRRLGQRAAARWRSTTTSTSPSTRPPPATSGPAGAPAGRRGWRSWRSIAGAPRATVMKLEVPLARESTATTPAPGWASSRTRRCASAARRARSRARSGTRSRCRCRGSRASPTTTRSTWAPTPGVTSRSSSSGCRPAWRTAPRWSRRRSARRRRRRRPAPTRRATGFRWLMASDVCKHCTHAACLEVCPTGALFRTEFGTVVVQQDVCNGCGYCVPGVPVRGARPA